MQDLTDPDLNLAGVPHERFAELRRTAPVSWIEQTPEARAGMAGDPGYWAVTRHADVAAASRNNTVFGSSANGTIVRLGPTATRADMEMTRVVITNQDDPEHAQIRRIVSRGFTPRAIAALEGILVERARRIVGEAVAQGEGDFVDQVTALLPLETIAELLGIPPEDRHTVYDWTNQMTGADDPEVLGDASEASMAMLDYAMKLAADRQATPRDDIVTKLVHAGKDGRGLSDAEFGFFVISLAVAGNETSRNAMTHGMNAFFDHREQWEVWCRERPATTVDEVIRWATPVTCFQRTAVEDVELGGQLIRAGQRIGMFYSSANYDEAVFDNPFEFDITRNPNPHLAFGLGVHFCLGASLARLELKVMFDALAVQAPRIRRAGEPIRLRSAWINGIRSLPVSYA